MKFAVLGDPHWGCRNDLPVFYDHFRTFYSKFFNDLGKQNIGHVLVSGDVFDRRKYVNFRTLTYAKQIFFEEARKRGICLYIIIGNHDIHMRETVEINSPSLLLGEYDNVYVYDRPETLGMMGTTIDMIPWICKDNEKQIMEFIANSKSDLCFGHFEIATFSMYKGIDSYVGLPPDMFEKYEKVISGHYHTRSEKNNIVYVGTPYEMTWQDYNDPKGYHIFDTETRQLEFCQNFDNIFVRLEYDDTHPLIELESLDVHNRFVKVVVTNKTDLYKFDNFMQKLYNMGAYEITILEDLSEFSTGEIGEEIDLEDTMDVLSNYIDSIETDADKDKIKTFMKSLYIEAINLEVV